MNVFLIHLLGVLVGLGVACLIDAILLRTAGRWFFKMQIPFGQAVLFTLVYSAVNLVLVLSAGIVAATTTAEHLAGMSVVLRFLVQASVISRCLHIRLRRALAISLTMFGMAMAGGVGLGILYGLFTVWCAA